MNTKEQQWIAKAVQLLKQMEFCGTKIDYSDWREPYADEHVCPICGCGGYVDDRGNAGVDWEAIDKLLNGGE